MRSRRRRRAPISRTSPSRRWSNWRRITRSIGTSGPRRIRAISRAVRIRAGRCGASTFRLRFSWLSAMRYVVLHHTGIPQPHFDLMFESREGSMLNTFRLPAWPLTGAVTVEKLADHRRDYLTYEGPLSGNRGAVKRVAEGAFRFRTQSEDALALDLDRGT